MAKDIFSLQSCIGKSTNDVEFFFFFQKIHCGIWQWFKDYYVKFKQLNVHQPNSHSFALSLSTLVNFTNLYWSILQAARP